MVHFHIHTDGTDSEDEGERHIIVSPIIIKAVWIGLSVFLWSAALFITIESIHQIIDL